MKIINLFAVFVVLLPRIDANGL